MPMPKTSKLTELFRMRVREEIADRETTISQVAKDASISVVHLSRVLGGKADASLAVALEIASALEMDLADLLDRKKISS